MVNKFLLIINFQCIYIHFPCWIPPKPLNWENYKLSIGLFGNLIFKCNELGELIRHKRANEVLYGLRYKQKDYLISHETPCRIYFHQLPSEIGFDWRNDRTFIQTWSVVEICNICKDQKLQDLCANIEPGGSNFVFD